MPIRVESQTVIECDECGYTFIEALTRKMVIKMARESKWTIGKKVICPDCGKLKDKK